jgi:hypothetical protein
LQRRQETIAKQIALVKTATKALRDQLAQTDRNQVPAGLIETAQASIKGAEQLLASAEETSGKGAELLQQAAFAGEGLKQAVDRIGGQVSALVVENTQDITQLSSLVAGLAQSYGGFVALPPSLQPAAGKAAAGTAQSARTRAPSQADRDLEQPLRDRIADLDAATAELTSTTRQIADVVNATAAAKRLEALKACGVSADQAASAISVEPASFSFVAGKGATLPGLVRGGATPYSVTLQGGAVDGLTVSPTEPFGPAFTVQTTAKTPEGHYVVYVSDRSGKRQFAQIEVAASSGGGGGGTKTDPKEILKSKKDDLPGRLLPKDIVVGSATFAVQPGPAIDVDTQQLTVALKRNTDKTVKLKKSDVEAAVKKAANDIGTKEYGATDDIIKAVVIKNASVKDEIGELE